MEVRASYVLVGLFVVALMASLLGFVVWTARTVGTRAIANYDILFTGTVTGLAEGSQVRYRGVPIGRVKEIRLDPENLERIRVTVDRKSVV
jgi:phospholipid/cholesterol/gamma-HCH transport system substrate-binding protein